MLSGIGDAEQLKQLGIPVRTDLPGVGQNFQDHPLVIGPIGWMTQPGADPKGQMTEVSLFWKSMAGMVVPDLQISLVHRAPFGEAFFANVVQRLQTGQPVTSAEQLVDPHVILTLPGLLRPLSRGWVRLRSSDPTVAPDISANYGAEPIDIDRLVTMVEIGRSIYASRTFAELGLRELSPGAEVSSPAQLRDWVVENTGSDYHFVGSCKMGIDRQAVVDPKLKVLWSGRPAGGRRFDHAYHSLRQHAHHGGDDWRASGRLHQVGGLQHTQTVENESGTLRAAAAAEWCSHTTSESSAIMRIGEGAAFGYQARSVSHFGVRLLGRGAHRAGAYARCGWLCHRFHHTHRQATGASPAERRPNLRRSAPGRPVTDELNAERTKEFDKSTRLDNPLSLKGWYPERPYRSEADFLRQQETYYVGLDELSAEVADKYDALLMVGGSGPTIDMVNNQRVHDLILTFYKLDKPIAAECYAVTCLAFARDPGGNRSSIISNKHITGHCIEYDYKDGHGVIGIDFNFGPPPYPLEYILRDATLPDGQYIGNFGKRISCIVDYPLSPAVLRRTRTRRVRSSSRYSIRASGVGAGERS